MNIPVRPVAGAVAAAITIDALSVGAPFLAIFAVPFAIAAWRYRSGRVLSRLGLGAWSALVVVIDVNYMLTNGLHMRESGVSEVINPGDFVGVYLGGPLALLLAFALVTSARTTRVAAA